MFAGRRNEHAWVEPRDETGPEPRLRRARVIARRAPDGVAIAAELNIRERCSKRFAGADCAGAIAIAPPATQSVLEVGYERRENGNAI